MAEASALAALGGVYAVEGFVEQLEKRPVAPRLMPAPSMDQLALEHILETGLEVVRESLRHLHRPRHIWATRPGLAKLGAWNLEFPSKFLFEIGKLFAHLPRAQWKAPAAQIQRRLLRDFNKPIEQVAQWEPMAAYCPDGSRRMFAQWPLPECMRDDE